MKRYLVLILCTNLFPSFAQNETSGFAVMGAYEVQYEIVEVEPEMIAFDTVYSVELAEFQYYSYSLSDYIISEIDYPEFAVKYDIEGTVYLQFTIAKTGDVIDINIISSPHESLSQVSIDCFEKMPSWKPAMINEDHPVAMRFIIPLTYRIHDERDN